MVTASTLLSKLPPFHDKWILIKEDQEVKDIKKRIEIAHRKYASFYDKIVVDFYNKRVDKVCSNIYDFIKENIEYREEPKEFQTTSLPTGILYRGYGDCKHYSLLGGGILNAIERKTGKKIDWFYRFACYWPNTTLHHVFIVVIDGNDEIWIDPVPNSNNAVPLWWQDKKVKVSQMALYENIAGVSTMGAFSPALQILPVAESTGATPEVTNRYLGSPFLGLERYVEDGGLTIGTNWQTTANAINAEIANGPSPGHTVTKDFVKWIFDSNMKFWNFYYPSGVKPFYNPSSMLPDNYPRLIITDDGRLTFDRDVKLDDAHNSEIHALNAWAQDLINRFDKVDVQPMKPETLKGFSQGKWGGVPGGNLFTQQRGASIFQQVGKALEKAVNFVKAGVLLIVGSIPRNAFLGLVGINAFNFAGNLWEKIQAGKWDAIANTWKGVGGNPTKLHNTIEDGKDKKAILGTVGNTIGAEPVTTSTAALMAAAAPIIAILLKFLDKDGKAGEIALAVKDTINNSGLFPQLKVDIGSNFDFLDRATGKPIVWQVNDADNENLGGGDNKLPTTSDFDLWQTVQNNPIPVAAGASVISFFILRKKGKKPNYIIPGFIAVATYFTLTTVKTATAIDNERKALLALPELQVDNPFVAAIKKMNGSEVHTLYVAAIIYTKAGKDVPNDIKVQVTNILKKYGLEDAT